MSRKRRNFENLLFPYRSPSPRPYPDPTQHPETDPKQTRNSPETEPKRSETDPKRTETEPKWTEIEGVGRPGGGGLSGWLGGGVGVVREKEKITNLTPQMIAVTLYPEGPTIKNIQSRSKFSISIEIFNLARKFQSRRLDFPTKNRAAVGGSLENFTLARNFQSRSKSRIFLIFGPSGDLWNIWAPSTCFCCFKGKKTLRFGIHDFSDLQIYRCSS